MKRPLLGSVMALTLMSVSNPVAARIPNASRPVPAKASLIVANTPQGFAIVELPDHRSEQQMEARRRLGSTIIIDAKLLKRSVGQ